MKSLSLIIPAYNEAKKISRDINALHTFLSEEPYETEVLFVDDGSKDDTRDTIRKQIERLSPGKVRFELLTYPENRGKGYAVRYGVLRAKGDVIGFMDAGLCVPLPYIRDALQVLEGESDFGIASRRAARSRVIKQSPLHRRVGSKVFWVLMRGLMGIQVSDTQCGFKFYRREAARKIFERVETEGFMFDIEALLVASRMGLKGVEFPVEWTNDLDSRYHPVFGTIRNFRELVRIRWRLLTQ